MAGVEEDRRVILPGSEPGRRSFAGLGLVLAAVVAAIAMIWSLSHRPAHRAPSAARIASVPPVSAPAEPAAEPAPAAASAAAANPAHADAAATTARNHAAIAAVIDDGLPGLKTCYQHALVRDDSLLRGRMTVRVSIAASGRVNTVNIAAPPAFRPMRRCLEAAISRWAFPAATTSYGAEFPLVLEAAR